MVAITLLLIFADENEPTAYPYGITLNGLIAIISTIGKGAMLSTVGVCVGQMKWNEFTSPSRYLPLSHFATIDLASRGILGSFLALFTAWRLPLVYAGALITVLSLGFDFSVQQLVGFENKSIPAITGASRPTLPRAQFFNYTADVPQGELDLCVK
jgi:hypothetical protein